MIPTRHQRLSKPISAYTPVPSGSLQRKCLCGNHAAAGGVCTEYAKKNTRLQRKLTLGASDDLPEREADRVADQVMAAPASPAVSSTPQRIQRHAVQGTEDSEDVAPPSVDRVLSNSGRQLEPSLR